MAKDRPRTLNSRPQLITTVTLLELPKVPTGSPAASGLRLVWSVMGRNFAVKRRSSEGENAG
jgi:hypothetical protein